MNVRAAFPRRHRLLGLWLALLALCALNVQGFEHYQRMLVEDAVCSVGKGLAGTGAPKSGAAHTGVDCALSCAQAQADLPVIVTLALVAVTPPSQVADSATASQPRPSAWPDHRPRGPPRQA